MKNLERDEVSTSSRKRREGRERSSGQGNGKETRNELQAAQVDGNAGRRGRVSRYNMVCTSSKRGSRVAWSPEVAASRRRGRRSWRRSKGSGGPERLERRESAATRERKKSKFCVRGENFE